MPVTHHRNKHYTAADNPRGQHATQSHHLVRRHRVGGHAGEKSGGSGHTAADRAIRNRAAKAGAAIVHIHVRDPVTRAQHGRRPLSGGGGAHPRERRRYADQSHHRPGRGFTPGADDPLKARPRHQHETAGQRVEHILALRPEICSLDMGSMNMGGYVFVNTPAYLEPWRSRSATPMCCPNWKCSRPAMCCSPSG